MIIKNVDEIGLVDKSNKIICSLPEGSFKMIESEIEFKGNNNVLYCAEGISLVRYRIVFRGNNSVVFLVKQGIITI